MAQEQDIVLIYFEEQPLVFARIESILADSKPNWYHVKLLMLQVPPTVVTWILRDIYINGESFTASLVENDWARHWCYPVLYAGPTDL